MPEYRPRDLPPPGRLVTDDDGARVQCHLCGRFYAFLAAHARQAHGLDAEPYRERFGLNREQGLASPAYIRRQRDVNGERLVRLQPAINPVTGVPPERRPTSKGTPKRLQARLATGAAQRRHLARHPRPRKERPPKLGNGDAGRARIAELMRDPAWRAEWRAKQAAGRRPVTDEQVRVIVALRGTMTQTAVAARYGISADLVRRLWREARAAE